MFLLFSTKFLETAALLIVSLHSLVGWIFFSGFFFSGGYIWELFLSSWLCFICGFTKFHCCMSLCFFLRSEYGSLLLGFLVNKCCVLSWTFGKFPMHCYLLLIVLGPLYVSYCVSFNFSNLLLVCFYESIF